MDDKKERLRNLKRRKVMWIGRDRVSIGHTEVIDFPQPEREKTDPQHSCMGLFLQTSKADKSSLAWGRFFKSLK